MMVLILAEAEREESWQLLKFLFPQNFLCKNTIMHVQESQKPKEEEMKVVLNEQRMDRYQKIQCWVILKHFMVERDGWTFNKTLDSKKLGILGNKYESVLLKPIAFEDIESKMHKFVYSGSDEFANDMRLLFSYGFMYPQRDQIHRVARRFNESFKITWKALTEKWSTE
ncbi:hypothetical protein AHAS_Ahas16G0234200 [Arachis hypogaea]